jgi:hypothetical protein
MHTLLMVLYTWSVGSMGFAFARGWTALGFLLMGLAILIYAIDYLCQRWDIAL